MTDLEGFRGRGIKRCITREKVPERALGMFLATTGATKGGLYYTWEHLCELLQLLLFPLAAAQSHPALFKIIFENIKGSNYMILVEISCSFSVQV